MELDDGDLVVRRHCKGVYHFIPQVAELHGIVRRGYCAGNEMNEPGLRDQALLR